MSCRSASAALFLFALLICGSSALNVAYFYNGQLNDASFNQLTNSGLQRLASERPTVNLTLLFLVSDQLLALGTAFPFPAGFESSDVVVCAGFQFASPILGWSSKFPNMKFVLIDVALEPSPANVNSCIFAEDQLGFLMGSVAGRMTKTGWVGTISGVEIPPVVRYGNGFQQGVYSTCPSCKVILSYVGSFSDGARGRDLAAYQKSLGVDVMISLSGFPGVAGVLSVANNTYMIGVDGDLYLSAFSNGSVAGAKNVLFSTAKGADTAAYVSVGAVLNNAFRSGTSLFQFSNGGLRVLPCHESCALYNPDTDPATLALKDALSNGAVATLVTSAGPLSYLSTLPKNVWALQTPNFAPAASASVSAAHVNDGFSDKVFYLLGSLGQAWLWWPTHRMWFQAVAPPPVIGAAVASSGGSSVYVFGGRENLLPTSSLWRWDWAETGDSWTQLNVTGVEPDPRGGAAMAFNDDGFYYLFGGSAFEFFNDVWRLNATTVEWTKLATTGDAPVGTEFAAMVSYRDSLIVYGGGDNQPEILAGIYQLNITTLAWRKLPITLPQRKFHTMVMSVNNTVIIVGGIDELKVRSDTVLAVNLDKREVRELPPFPYAVQSHGAAAYGDLVWVFGGSLENGTRLNSTYAYAYSKEELTPGGGRSQRALRLKLGLGIGLSLFVVVVIVGVVVAVLMRRYHLIVISKENVNNDAWS